MANSATHAALPFPVQGARFSVLIPYLDADGDPTDPTTPDTERSLDAGAFADCTEEVTTISGSNGMGYITLTGDETNCSMLAVVAKVASGPKATLATLYPRVLGIVTTGTAQAGAAGTITLAAGAPAHDLTGCIVKTTGGTGGGGGSGSLNNQARVITAYNTSTKVATVVPNWETNPSSDTTYAILMTDMRPPAAASVGVASGNLDAQLTAIDDFMDTEVAAIKAKTDNLPGDPADASDIASSFATVNTKLDTIDDFLDTEIAAIKAKTDNLPSDPADQSAVEAAITAATSPLATAAALDTVDNLIDTEVAAIKTVTDALGAAAAAKLALAAATMITGTVDNTAHTPTTTQFEADDITEATADHYNGLIIKWLTGALTGQTTEVSDYALTGGRGHFTVVAMTEAPANNDTFILI